MADYKKGSQKGMRFDNGKPMEKRGRGTKPSYNDDKKGGFSKKNAYVDRDGYRKNDRGRDDYRNNERGRDDYKKRDYGKDSYKKRDFDGEKRDRRENSFDNKRKYDNERRNSYEERNHSRENFEPQQVREDELPFIIMGRNAVREAIKSGRSIDKILVIPERDGSLGEIMGMARDRNILIQEERREKLDELCMPFGHGEKTGNHQGIVARVPGAEYVDIGEILNYASERNEKPFILLLDGITDPYNFGSIIRSAECAGVHGIIIPKRRSATLTSSAVKVSAGAASHMRIAKVPNIASAIDRLHENNIWVAGADMEGQSVYKTDMRGAMAIVIGSEDEGLSALVRKKCDYIVSAPIKGHIDSLNAAVASAVLMYEKVRQDG